MLDKLHAETCTLKMRLISLGLALAPPACIYQNKLKQIHADFYEMAFHIGYRGPKELMRTSHYVFLHVLGLHFALHKLPDLSAASACAWRQMSHYFSKSERVR